MFRKNRKKLIDFNGIGHNDCELDVFNENIFFSLN